MRTTIDIDDQLLRQLRAKAAEEGVSLKELVNAALRRDLTAQATPRNRPDRYRCPSFAMGQPASLSIDLDKALALADALADAEIARKLELRK